MIIMDKKKAMQSIMARRHPKDGDTMSAPMASTEVKNEHGDVDPRHVAAQDILMAVHEAHPEKLMSSLKNFIDLHNISPTGDTAE